MPHTPPNIVATSRAHGAKSLNPGYAVTFMSHVATKVNEIAIPNPTLRAVSATRMSPCTGVTTLR